MFINYFVGCVASRVNDNIFLFKILREIWLDHQHDHSLTMKNVVDGQTNAPLTYHKSLHLMLWWLLVLILCVVIAQNQWEGFSNATKGGKNISLNIVIIASFRENKALIKRKYLTLWMKKKKKNSKKCCAF